jgi:enediyne biosynthesis protein E4
MPSFASHCASTCAAGRVETRRKFLARLLPAIGARTWGLGLVGIIGFAGAFVLPGGATAITFSDQAAAAGIDDEGQANGGAWGDFDGDGWADLAVFRFSPRTDALLYRNQGDGTFGLEQGRWNQAPQRSLGGIFIDYDGDGDLDIYSVHLQLPNALYRNDGGRFSRLTMPDSIARPQVSLGAAFADFDDDAALDILVVNRLAQGNRILARFYRPGFSDISTAFSALRGGRDSFSALPFDYDGDGDLDLHVANRGAPDLLHRNDGGGVYQPVAADLGVDYAGATQVAFAGDYDNDGDLDLYLANGDNEPNVLLRNDAGQGFKAVQDEAGVGGQASSAAAAWADFDRDGWLDLLVANGAAGLTVYRNRGNGSFEDVSAVALPEGWAENPPRVNGLALADYDRDGDIDAFVSGNGIADILLRNDTVAAGHWLGLDLGGALPGVSVTLRQGDRSQRQQYMPRLALGSAEGALLYFGLGDESRADLEVVWPSGRRQLLRQVEGDQVLRLQEPVALIDARISRVWAPALQAATQVLAPDIEIENNGSGILDGAILEWQVRQGKDVVHRAEKSVPALAPGDKVRLQFSGWSASEGTYRLFVELRTGVAPGQGDIWQRQYHFHPLVQVAEAEGVADAGAGWAAAWADYDNDGDLDLYVSNGGSAGAGDNVLFRNEEQGFVDATGPSGTGDGGNGTGAVFADFDGDGDQDLLIAKGGFLPQGEANRLFLNRGDATFADVSEQAGLDEARSSYAAVVGDWDGDGLLDLYLTQFRTQFNRLYRNLGGGSFVDVTGPKEVRSSNFSSGAGGIFSDYDNDGGVELYASFYGSQNILYAGLNDGSNRIDILGDEGDNVGLALADYDSDGYVDLYTVNESGRNVLYRNQSGVFVDVGAESGTENIAPGTGAAWGDYDNDGDEDLFVVNGAGPNRVYMNRGDGSFVDVAAGLGFVGGALARAVVMGDYDNDGDVDTYVVNEGMPNRLYRNDGRRGNWLQVGLRGVESNTDAIGARLQVFADGRRQTLEVNGTAGASHSSRLLHVGLGSAERVDSLVVRWPSGHRESYRQIEAGRRLDFVEGQATTAVAQGPTPRLFWLGQNWPNPFNASTRIAFSLERDGPVRLEVYNALGQRVSGLVADQLAAGTYSVDWDATDASGRSAASGVYFYRLEAEGVHRTRSMLLAR